MHPELSGGTGQHFRVTVGTIPLRTETDQDGPGVLALQADSLDQTSSR